MRGFLFHKWKKDFNTQMLYVDKQQITLIITAAILCPGGLPSTGDAMDSRFKQERSKDLGSKQLPDQINQSGFLSCGHFL
jgi:hypothetical protein